jgi:DNA repair exonuclease SbcCD ATPase subunit
LNLSELLSFDPASIGSAILEADDHQPQPTGVAGQLLHIKDLLSAPIDTLVQDPDEVRRILEEIKPQLPEILQLKLWPTRHLPFFRAKVEKARQRIEAHRSQAPLKADIAERCRLLNKKKMALDVKVDTSAHSQRFQSLERELEDLKAKVRATEQCIQDEKDLIAHSQQEAENLAAQLKTELTELSVLSRQIVSGEDKDDEAVIAEADRVCLEAIAAIDEFLL